MESDPFSPIAPARIRCLLLPYGKITRSDFASFAARLQQESIVRLSDISPDGRPYKNMFSPLAFPTGLILYDLMTSNPTIAQTSLAPLEFHRLPIAVIAVADAKSYLRSENYGDGRRSSLGEVQEGDAAIVADRYGFQELSENLEWLKEQYQSALVHQIFVFDCEEISAALATSLTLVPPLDKCKTTTMKTIMCDLTSLILAEMATYAKSLLSMASIETPKSPYVEQSSSEYRARPASQPETSSRPQSRISETLNSRSSSPTADAPRRIDDRSFSPSQMASGVPSRYRNEDDTSRPLSNGTRTPPITFEGTSGLPGRPAPSAEKENPLQMGKDRVSIHGSSSGTVGERARNKVRGRQGVVLGSMYLLAGRWPDAIRELVESAVFTRANNDHVWHAKALDYILVCLLMCAWAGMDFDIPQVCYPSGDKSSPGSNKSAKHTPTSSVPDLTVLKSPNAANRLVSLQNLCSLLPDLVNTILRMYIRAATFTADQLPQLAFSESVIRFANILAIIQISHGILDDYGLQCVVLHQNIRERKGYLPSQFVSFPTKSEISSILLSALPSPATEQTMDITHRIKILTGIGSVFIKLGYHRKKGFILREILTLLLPALVQSMKDSAAELGVHPAASLSSLDLVSGTKNSIESRGRRDSPEPEMSAFLWLLCEVYGITTSFAPEVGTGDPADNIATRATQNFIVRSFGSLDLKLDLLRYCINLCEALPDLGNVLGFSSTLLRVGSSGIAPGPESRVASPSLSVEDQIRLSTNILRTSNAATQMGFARAEADYWDEFLVRHVEILQPSLLKIPVLQERARHYLADGIGKEKKEGPFIHNPFGTKPGFAANEATLVAKDEATFTIMVQNLFDFDLEVERIRLDSTGIEMEAQDQSVVIGPYRTQALQLTGIPQSPGKLNIHGCVAKVKGCKERRFLTFDRPWTGKGALKIKKMGLAAAESAKERPTSTESAIVRSHRQQTVPAPVTSTLSIDILEPQPRVNLKSISLSQSAIMILEGETKQFSLTLQNLSSVLVDLLLLTFSDSTTNSLRAALANKELSAAEIFEIELALFRAQVFRWRHENNNVKVTVAPQGENSIIIELEGKPGLSQGTIHIDYGQLGDDTDNSTGTFYTRRLSIPLAITVNPSIELIRNEFLPFTRDFAWRNHKRYPISNGSRAATPQDRRPRAASRITKTENRFQALLERLGLGSHGDDHCLLLLDFYNAWLNPLSISVQVRENTMKDTSPGDPWKRAYTVHEVLQPGQTSRLVLLLPRISLQDPFAPVPSLDPTTKRQFVVSASKISPDLERSSRESFWLREEILKHMRATWEEDVTGRHGNIELRAIRLTPNMVRAVKLEDFGINMSLSGISCPPPQHQQSATAERERKLRQIYQSARSAFHAPVDSFLTLIVKLTNRLPHPILPLLRLQPSLRHQPSSIALDLGKRFAFNGLLQRTLPLMNPGESREVEMGCVFLCPGEFEIGASVEEVKIWSGSTSTAAVVGDHEVQGRSRAEIGELGIGLAVEERTVREVWYAREPCVVEVVDVTDMLESTEKERHDHSQRNANVEL